MRSDHEQWIGLIPAVERSSNMNRRIMCVLSLFMGLEVVAGTMLAAAEAIAGTNKSVPMQIGGAK